MRQKRLNAVKLVASRLFAAEQAIDLAAARIAELNAMLPLARLDANLSAVIGQDAVETSAQAMMSVARVRNLIVTTHLHLSKTQSQIGLGEVAFGDELKIPPRQDLSPQPALREVA